MEIRSFNPYIYRLFELATKLFPGNVQMADNEAPDYLVFKINNLPTQQKNYQPKHFEISLDDEANFMFIDDFRWEFDGDVKKTEAEINRYLMAASKGELRVAGIKYFNQRLTEK